MFGKIDMRYKIALFWLIIFISLWVTFYSTSPSKKMIYQLDRIEQSITRKDWKQANEYMTQFKATFIENRMLIQMNNSTEAFISFQHTIGQLETTIRHNQESALDYIGAVRELIDLVVKPFSGP